MILKWSYHTVIGKNTSTRHSDESRLPYPGSGPWSFHTVPRLGWTAAPKPPVGHFFVSFGQFVGTRKMWNFWWTFKSRPFPTVKLWKLARPVVFSRAPDVRVEIFRDAKNHQKSQKIPWFKRTCVICWPSLATKIYLQNSGEAMCFRMFHIYSIQLYRPGSWPGNKQHRCFRPNKLIVSESRRWKMRRRSSSAVDSEIWRQNNIKQWHPNISKHINIEGCHNLVFLFKSCYFLARREGHREVPPPQGGRGRTQQGQMSKGGRYGKEKKTGKVLES